MVATNISAKRASGSPACRVFCAPINVSETTSWSNSLNIHQCFTFPYMSETGMSKQQKSPATVVGFSFVQSVLNELAPLSVPKGKKKSAQIMSICVDF